MSRIFVFTILIFLSKGINLLAQPEIKAQFTDSPPSIDGFVNDAAWNTASPVSDLLQREPRNGDPASELTEFRFLFDKNNMYIGIICNDDPEGITAKELARDVSLGDDDRIQVIFDTFLDGRSGYWFQIGPRGSIGDAIVNENGKDFNKSWDGIWDGKARITEKGWEAEMIIPFKTLGFKKGNETWGLKLIRYIKRKSEMVTWPVTSLNADKFAVSDAGRITGLKGITQGIGLDLIPYITGGVSKKQDKDPGTVFDGGIDAFYQITPSLKAAVTVNTDFAQTEVDERQINLTRFNLYFPEKRDFFIDGSNFFSFGINGDRENRESTRMIPFFSRRIGLDADGSPVQVKYGGKFTGKAGRWNLGLMHIGDDNQWDNPGYTIGRVSMNFGKQSSVGIIGTSGNAVSKESNSLAGIDIRLAKPDLLGNKNIIFNLYALKSFTDSLGGNDYSFGTEINYPNDLLNFRIGYMQIGGDFLPGLGFVPRDNIRNFYGSLFLGPRPKNSPILQIKSGIDYSIIQDLSTGKLQTADAGLDLFRITLLSGDEALFSTDFTYEALEKEFNIYDTINIPAGNYTFWRPRFMISTAKRRNLWGSARIEFGTFYSGKRTDLSIQAGYKVAVPVFIGFESDRRWVNLAEGDFVTQIYRLNLNLLFGPNMTWYNFAQYDNKSETIGWQSRFQWIIKPGKEIFLTFNSPLIDPLERFRPEVYEARVKIKYAIRF